MKNILLMGLLMGCTVTTGTGNPERDPPDAYEGEWAHAGNFDASVEDQNELNECQAFWDVNRDSGTAPCTCLNTGQRCPDGCLPSRFPYMCGNRDM